MISTAVESILGILSVVAGLGIFLAIFYALAYPIILVFKRKMLHSNTERTAAHIMLGFSAFAILWLFIFHLSAKVAQLALVLPMRLSLHLLYPCLA